MQQQGNALQQATQQPVQSNKLYIDLSGRGGLAPRWFGDEGDTLAQHPEFRYLGTQDQITPTLGESTAYDLAAGIWNPSRRYGFMAPANNSFTSVSNGTGTSFGREIRATCFDPVSQYAFFAENGSGDGTTGGSVFQNASITSNTWGLNSSLSWPISGAIFTDLAMYQINGTDYLFACYTTNESSGDILVMTPSSGSGGNATWLTATSSGGSALKDFDHFFIPSSYYMYVVDYFAVHRIDGTSQTGGTNGTALMNVLLVAPNLQITAGTMWNGNIWLGVSENTPPSQQVSNILPFSTALSSAYSSNQARVYTWDESVTSIENVDYITITGVITIQKLYVTRSGKLRMVCISSKRTLQIREYNGVTFDVIEEAGIESAANYRGSYSQGGDLMWWVGRDNNIYTHGPVAPGEIDQLTIQGNISGIPNNASKFTGATLFLDNNNATTTSRTGLFVSIYDSTGTTTYNKMWYPNATGNTPHVGNVYSLVKYFPELVKVNYARVYHHVGTISNASTQQGTLSIYLNQATSANKTFSITQQDIAHGYKYCPINQGAITGGAVFAIQVEIQWATGTTTADATDWLPRILEVDYTPISKLL